MLRWFHALMPKEERFFELFARHSKAVLAGAQALRAMMEGGAAVAPNCQTVMDREHDADDATREVLIAVRRTFITPFDRGSIRDLITAMDNSIDQMQKTAKSIKLFDVKEFTPQQKDMADAIVQCARLVQEAVPLLRSISPEAGRISAITERISALEGQADEMHDQGLHELYTSNAASGNALKFFVGNEVYEQVARWAWLRRPAQALWLAAGIGILMPELSGFFGGRGSAVELLRWLQGGAVAWAGLELLAALPLARPYSDLPGPLLAIRPWLPAILPAAGFVLLWRHPDGWLGVPRVRDLTSLLLLLTSAPSVISARPMRPVIGAFTSEYSRLSLAVARPASAMATSASAAASCATASSNCCAEATFDFFSCSCRSAACLACNCTAFARRSASSASTRTRSPAASASGS